MASYTAKVSWSRKPDEAFTDGRFSRAHVWAFDGGAAVPASSSPQVVRPPLSDPAGVDPEEALVAALSSCHMLFFLEFARQNGFVVDSYVDDAAGSVGKGADGRIRMTSVALKPHLVFGGEKRPSQADVETLHHKAHDACYIANSVNCEIKVEGENEGLAPV
jgi:organic hydroperoxide reductase OsmC/OhrA